MPNDLLLPSPPENLSDTDSYEDQEIDNHDSLQSISPLAIELSTTHQPIEDKDLDYLNLHSAEKSMLKAELIDSQMYLKNIHSGFKFARSTRSLINLVGAGLAVHKHRRQLIKDLKEAKKDPFELDEHGNIKP